MTCSKPIMCRLLIKSEFVKVVDYFAIVAAPDGTEALISDILLARKNPHAVRLSGE